MSNMSSLELIKSFADRLADQIMPTEVLKLARALMLPSWSDASQQRSIDRDAAIEDSVGIWRRKDEGKNVVFVRDPKKRDEWRHWANVGRIPSKGSKLRIVLLGESVARGYLYDPIYTPATILEQALSSALGRNSVEVIDLARTTMAFEVQEVAKAAICLRPDLVVLFGGNNWRCECPIRSSNLPHLSALVSKYGVVGLKTFAEHNLKYAASRTVNDIASFYADHDIPAVWIIPEFNLDDWKDPISSAPYLLGDNNSKWLICQRSAHAALEKNDETGCIEAASEMISLDGGTTACGFYLLAEAFKRLGEVEKANNALILAKDASIWDTSMIYAPRAFSLTQEVLRDEPLKYGNAIVDCSALFSFATQGRLPCRNLFLDYCHLTSYAIRLTMAATAAQILRTLAKQEVELDTLVEATSTPSKETESEAHFLAAVHNAHWWQGPDIIQFHASKALQGSTHLKSTLVSYIELQTRRAPSLMCKAAETVMTSTSPQIQHYLLRYNNQQLDQFLIAALAAALEEIGEEITAYVDKLRVEEHGTSGLTIDMLEYYYCSSGRQAQELGWVTPLLWSFVPSERHYYRAFTQNSRFRFVSRGEGEVQITIVYRVPAQATTDGVDLLINGTHLVDLPHSSTWVTYDIRVPGTFVQNGINNVLVRWPLSNLSRDGAIRQLADDIILGRSIMAYPSFGDIYSLDLHL
jgi:hypothetical protein